ncbi:MAG TPA: S8 family serine peptidase [Dokdonella sp.]|nr:S8 family serine peptidase [Dokdonella sp.]
MTSLPARTALAAALTIALGAAAPHAIAANTVIAGQPSLDAIDAARGNPDLILLRAGVFDPARQTLDTRAVGAPASTESNYAIVQFEPARLKSARDSLVARGVEILGYVPNNAYYVRLNGVRLADVAQTASVRWAGAVAPAFKLDPALWSSTRTTSAALQNDGRYELVIQAFDGVSSAAVEGQLVKQVPGVEITLRSTREQALPYVRAKVDAATLDRLIDVATGIDGVAFVSPWIAPHTTNAGGIGAIQGNLTGTCAGSGPVCGPTPLFDQGITGGGQIVAVADSGTTPNAAWFATLDKGSGPHTEVTFAENPPPLLPNVGTLHPDNKIIAYWTQPGGPTDYDFVSGHGTHTTGTVVGDAAGTFGATTYMPSTPYAPNHDLADGMAPNAQLLFQDIGPNQATAVITQDFEGTLEQAYNGGARIHSDSWGSSSSGQYTTEDANTDRATRKDENLLVVIAAGNDQAGAMAVGSPGNSKNAVTVAALGHAGSLVKASFSNAGPTADGRQKPDVAAPGTGTISARNGTSVTTTITAPLTVSNSGTSMATPTIAGNAVLLRQYFADGFYPRGTTGTGIPADLVFADGFDGASPFSESGLDAFNPTGAVMKAVLLNGTVPTTSPSAFPNTGTGWGRPWLDSNLWFKNTMPNGDDSRRLRVFERTNASGLETGDVNEYTIANVGAGVELRVTLAWFDPDASIGAASTLVNNLDLEVVGPGGTYLGNHFSGNVSVPGGTADAKDTVEQVRLTAPSAGSYTIRVKGTSIPGNGRAGSDRQGYGLAVSGKFALPDATPFAAPTAPTIGSNGTGGISVNATAAAGAQGWQLYRADGTCATAEPGDFHLVANGTSLPLNDDTSQGGYSYAYKLRGVQNDIEGDASQCVDVVSLDDCSLQPDFDTHSLASDASNASCSVNLSWAAGASNCPAANTVTYTVERDTSPYFTAPTTVATALATTTFSDAAVSNGTPYFYRVHAVDGAGNASPTSVAANATPSGVDGPDPGAYVDDVDTHSYLTLEAPWQITNVAASAGSYSYHNGSDASTYLDNTCASITTPTLAITPGATLSFQAKYDLEFQWDGVVQEISTDGGNTWADLPPTGGYPSSFAQTGAPPVNACGYAASHGAFNGVTTAGSNADPNNGTATAVFKPFSTSLASFVGQSVQIRWRFSSDPAAGFSGFFLDQVQISGAPGAGSYVCTP